MREIDSACDSTASAGMEAIAVEHTDKDSATARDKEIERRFIPPSTINNCLYVIGSAAFN